MTSKNGADVPKAIAEFVAAGWTIGEIADDLTLHPSTVYRWRTGRRSPSADNYTALRELVDARAGQLIHRRRLTPAAMHLQQAAQALWTTEERAESDRLAAQLAEVFAQRAQRDAEGAARRNQEMAALRDSVLRAQRVPRQSVYGQVDPFALIGRDGDMAAVEAVGF